MYSVTNLLPIVIFVVVVDPCYERSRGVSKYWLFYILRVKPQQKGKICNVCCKKKEMKNLVLFILSSSQFFIYFNFLRATNIEDMLMQPFLDIAKTLFNKHFLRIEDE